MNYKRNIPKAPFVVAPLILIVTAVVFSNTLTNSFIENIDDNAYILHNETIKHLNWNNIKEIFTTFFQGNYHPLTLLSYTIEYKFFGLNPFVFHLTNYVLHILNTLLVYIFLFRFTGRWRVAAIAALFFGIHPMHVESVAWIAERKDMLYSFFFLLSLICYTKYNKDSTHMHGISTSVWTFFWFFLSLLSKPAAVCLPLVLVLMDFRKSNKFSGQMVTSKIPFFAISLLFGILTIFSQRSFNDLQAINQFYTVLDKVFLFSYAVTFYLVKAFAPFNLSAMHYYPYKVNGMLPMEYYVALPVLILLIFAVFKTAKSQNLYIFAFYRILLFGLLFYLITIALVLQVMPVGQAIVSERYSYIPYIGIFFIAGEFYDFVLSNYFHRRTHIPLYISIALIFLTVFFSFLTYQRNKLWKNGEVLFTDVISKYPKYGYSWFLLGNSENEKKNFDDAIIKYTKAITLAPNFADAYLNRGMAEDAQKNLDAAMHDYTRAIELNPNFADAYFNRGNTENEKKDFDAAIFDFTKTIELNPTFADAYLNRGNSENQKMNLDAALKDYKKAAELAPNPVSAYYNLGIVEDEKLNFDAAINDYTQAIKIAPAYTDAWFNRGNSEREKKDFDAAILDYTKVAELAPNPFAAYYNLGVTESEKKDFRSAIVYYTKALELSPKYAAAYFNRANAKFNINDNEGACKDWQLAQQLGSVEAEEALKEYCKLTKI